MATIKREKELPGVANGSDDGGGKRQCTHAVATTAVPIKQEPEETKNETNGGSRNTTNNNNNKQQQPVVTNSPNQQNGENDALPTSIELSKEFCRIVDTDKYSRAEAIGTLIKLNQWLLKNDANFLKYFHFHGGIIKVLDFVTATMNDVNCTGNIRFDCIKHAAAVIRFVVSSEAVETNNYDTILKILASAVNYGGLDILINASEEYTGGDDISALNALSTVWFALANIYEFDYIGIYELDLENEIMKEKANAVVETGIDVLSHLKLASITDASSAVLGYIFRTFKCIAYKSYVTKDYIETNNCISKCLDVFKKNDGTWKDNKNFERPAQHAITFLDRCHFRQRLFNGDSDYTLILSFCAFVLKNFGTNKIIRVIGTKFVNNSFSFVQDKNIIKRSGCMEALAFLLASNKIGEDEKRIVGALIGRIATLP